MMFSLVLISFLFIVIGLLLSWIVALKLKQGNMVLIESHSDFMLITTTAKLNEWQKGQLQNHAERVLEYDKRN